LLSLISFRIRPHVFGINFGFQANMQCSFTLHVLFNLKNYNLAGKNTCGANQQVPIWVPFNFYSTGVYQYDTVFYENFLALGGSGVHELSSGSGTGSTLSDPTALDLTDSFMISFQAYVHQTGVAGNNEGMSLNFLKIGPTGGGAPAQALINNGYSFLGLTNQPYISLVLATYGCNSVSIFVNGNISYPTAYSQRSVFCRFL